MGYLKWIRQLKCQHYKWVFKEGDEFNKTMIRVAGDTNNIGVTVEKLSALQADFNYNLGRTLMLSDKNPKLWQRCQWLQV
jgi:hypothetical protein